MKTSVTLQVLLFAAGAAALAQSPGTFTSTGSLTFRRRIGYTTTVLHHYMWAEPGMRLRKARLRSAS